MFLIVLLSIICVALSHYTLDSFIEFERENTHDLYKNGKKTIFTFEDKKHELEVRKGLLKIFIEDDELVYTNQDTKDLMFKNLKGKNVEDLKVRNVTTTIHQDLIYYHIISTSLGYIVLNTTDDSAKCYNCGMFLRVLHNRIGETLIDMAKEKIKKWNK